MPGAGHYKRYLWGMSKLPPQQTRHRWRRQEERKETPGTTTNVGQQTFDGADPEMERQHNETADGNNQHIDQQMADEDIHIDQQMADEDNHADQQMADDDDDNLLQIADETIDQQTDAEEDSLSTDDVEQLAAEEEDLMSTDDDEVNG
ncbi:uncharacterized protein LOC144459415 [Epinephelus lanceolatus]